MDRDKGIHCCHDMHMSLTDWDSVPLEYENIEDVGARYGLRDLKSEDPTAISINFCPFCGEVLPGAFITDWDKHPECERCHWTSDGNSAMIPSDDRPPCICSRSYEELKRIQNETNQSD